MNIRLLWNLYHSFRHEIHFQVYIQEQVIFRLTVDNLGNSDCISSSSSPHGASVKMAQVHADPAVRLHLNIIFAICLNDVLLIWNDVWVVTTQWYHKHCMGVIYKIRKEFNNRVLTKTSGDEDALCIDMVVLLSCCLCCPMLHWSCCSNLEHSQWQFRPIDWTQGIPGVLNQKFKFWLWFSGQDFVFWAPRQYFYLLVLMLWALLQIWWIFTPEKDLFWGCDQLVYSRPGLIEQVSRAQMLTSKPICANKMIVNSTKNNIALGSHL